MAGIALSKPPEALVYRSERMRGLLRVPVYLMVVECLELVKRIGEDKRIIGLWLRD